MAKDRVDNRWACESDERLIPELADHDYVLLAARGLAGWVENELELRAESAA